MKAKSRKKLIIIGIIIVLPICLLLLSEWLFPSFWGSYNLGKGLYMMEWDNNSRLIVYCSNPRGNTCYSGIPIIPSSLSDDIRVNHAKSNKKWIIVETSQNNDTLKKHYYIIDKSYNIKGLDWKQDRCDSIIQSHIVCFDNEEMFKNKLYELGIELGFK